MYLKNDTNQDKEIVITSKIKLFSEARIPVGDLEGPS